MTLNLSKLSDDNEHRIKLAIMHMNLLFSCQNHLLSLGTLRHAFLGVFPNIVHSSFDSRKLLLLDLSRFLDSLGHMAVILNSSDLRHVRVPPDKSLIVFEFLALLGAFDAGSG